MTGAFLVKQDSQVLTCSSWGTARAASSSGQRV